jgi:uroporphyrinogen decarboxylase
MDKIFRQDKMIPVERMKALLAGKPIDRVPLFLFAVGFAARNAGYPIASIFDDPEKSFWAQYWTQEMYGQDDPPRYRYASYGGWEFGGDIRFPKGEYEMAPVITRYPVETEDDVWDLELPDVRKAGALPIIMEMSKLSKKLGLPVVPSCGSAFTRAGNLCGMDKFLRWMAKKPDVAHHLLRLVTDHIIQVAQYWVDTFGVDPIWAWSAESSGSNDLISGRHFEEFALPYLIEVHEKLLAMGIKTFHFHLSGKEKQNLPFAAKVPLGDQSMVSIDHPTDLDEAIRVFGERAVIVGNVDTSVIQTGTPRQVYELSKQCIERGKRAPRGFILSPGDEIPPDAPPYNVFMMRKAINDFGWYD